MSKKTRSDKPRFIYDGDCAFCRRWIHYSQRITKDAVAYHAYQDVADEFPSISQNEFQNAVKLITPDGTIWSGAAATFRTLAYNPNRTTLLWLYNTIPGFSILSEWVYRRIARHRDAALKTTEFFFGPTKE